MRLHHHLAKRIAHLVAGGHLHVVKRLVWAAIGWFIAFGLLHGPGGNGAVILAAAVVGAVVLARRDPRARPHHLSWLAMGGLSPVVPIVVGLVLWPQRCTPTGCTVWPAAGSLIVAVLSNGGLALAAVAAAELVESYRRRHATGRG